MNRLTCAKLHFCKHNFDGEGKKKKFGDFFNGLNDVNMTNITMFIVYTYMKRMNVEIL